MATYRPIRDITVSKSRLAEDVDPDLAVLNIDNTKSFMPIGGTASKQAADAVTDEIMKKRMSFTLGADLLEKSGWGNGTRLPFASKENDDLEKALEIRQRRYLAIQTELRDNKEHLQMLEENFTRASEDLVAYQNFLANRKRQIVEEKNYLSLAERFYSKVKQEHQQTKKVLKECNDRCNRMKIKHDKRLKNLYELRDLIEFDREALKEYHDRLDLYKNEKLELGRIILEDSKTVEEIDQTYVELGAKRKVLKMELDQQAMTTSKCQEQLDRLSVEFRKVYRHRQEMAILWSSNIESAKRKDAQMHEIADDYFETREKIRDLNSELDFRERQYKSIQCSIRNSQLQVSDLDKRTGEMRRRMQEEKNILGQLNDSIYELQQDIRSFAVEEHKLHNKHSKMDSDSKDFSVRLEKMRVVVEKYRQKLEEAKSLKRNSDQNINELEKILADEMKRGDAVLREMDITRAHFWERSNDKKAIALDIYLMEMSVQRLKSNLGNLEAKEYNNLEFLARQSARVYRMDLEGSTLENKLSRVENDSVNPHFYMLQAELTQLRETSKRLGEEKTFIGRELTHLEHLITKNSAELAKNRAEKKKLNTELLEINMVSQRTQNMMDQSDKEYQSLQVENSLETVNYKRLADALKLAKEQLYGLSEERKTIYWAVNERKNEIESNRTLNMNKSKALLEAVNRLKVQIQEMEGRTEKLKGRFVLVTKLMADSQSPGSDDETIADKVRKAARVRESLQLELRKWEQRVEEAKHERHGLENVQKLLHSSNMAVKEKLTPIKEGSIESQELELLEQEEKSIHVRKRRAARFKLVLLDKVEDLKQQMAVMEQETQATAQLCKMKTAMASKIENELHRGKEKLQRWSSLCCRLLKEVKPMIQPGDYDILQKDLRLKFVQEKMECAINMLERLLSAFPEYRKLVVDYFESDPGLRPLSIRVRRSVVQHSNAHKATSQRTDRTSISQSRPISRFSLMENSDSVVSRMSGERRGSTHDQMQRSSMTLKPGQESLLSKPSQSRDSFLSTNDDDAGSVTSSN